MTSKGLCPVCDLELVRMPSKSLGSVLYCPSHRETEPRRMYRVFIQKPCRHREDPVQHRKVYLVLARDGADAIRVYKASGLDMHSGIAAVEPVGEDVLLIHP